MSGKEIFMRSLKLVFANFGPALRMSLLLVLAMTVANIWLTTEFLNSKSQIDDDGSKATIILPILVQFGFLAISYLWIAVAWHRYILLEEKPGAVLPAFNGQAILGYLKKGLFLLLIIVVAIVPFALAFMWSVAAFADGLRPKYGWMVVIGATYFLVIPISYLVLRLALILPAAAIGKEYGIGDSWRATQPVSKQIWIIGTLFAVIIFLFGVLQSYVAYNFGFSQKLNGSFVALVVVRVVYNWLFLMISVSILTTIYGFLVEQRELG